jgi:hypothetical protein
MPLQRKSRIVSQLQMGLRALALREEDEEKRRRLWRLYYMACNAEHEIRSIVMDAEMRRLLDFVFPDGLPAIFEDEKPKKFDSQPPEDDDNQHPKQKGLWD